LHLINVFLINVRLIINKFTIFSKRIINAIHLAAGALIVACNYEYKRSIYFYLLR